MSTNPGYGTIDREYARRLASTEPAEDGPVWMVNLLHYREVASYAGSADTEGVSGREADDRYAPTQILRDLGAEVVLVGDVEDQLLGDEPRWDRVAVVRYPTRRSFMDMQRRDDFKAKHVHKEAGVASTINMGCQPASVPALVDAGESLPDWTDVVHPPTPEDGPVVVLHVIRYSDEEGAGGASRSEMDQYEQAAARVAVPHGVRVGGWFDVEGTIVGDGRAWHQVRFNRFPSKAAFMAVVTDPARLAAHRAHRAPAMADTYTMILRPTIDRMGEVDPRGC